MLVFAFVAAACASAPAATTTANESVANASSCAGVEVLKVRNEFGAPLDIFIIEGASTTLLGSVSIGPAEITLPPQRRERRSFVGRAATGEWVWPAGMMRRPASRLSFEVVCRDAS